MGFVSPSAKIFSSNSFSFSANDPLTAFSWVLGIGLLTGFVVYGFSYCRQSGAALDLIPIVGGSNLWSHYRPVTSVHLSDMVQIGYNKYKSRLGIFRLLQRGSWYVIVSGRQYIEELAHASEDVFSFAAAVEETMHSKHLFGPTVNGNPYHVDLVRVTLNRNLGRLLPEVKHEVMLAFDDNIPITDDWTPVVAYPVVTQIVARISSRIFVGVPLCRNPEYLEAIINYTSDIFKDCEIIGRFPSCLRGIATRLFTNVPKAFALVIRYIGPIIEERQTLIHECGPDYPDKPNDFMAWLMDAAEGDERSPSRLTNRLLTLNLAAIHTSSATFTHALFHLAAEPKYLAPLREEIEEIIKEGGWSKVSLGKMHKLDSFLKETQRITGLGIMRLTRKAMKDYTFSNGTFIPKGTFISAPQKAILMDDEKYPNAHVFDGFRFWGVKGQGEGRSANQYTTTSPDYLPFGHGKHACPGRFFASAEFKVMFAHLVLNYDVKMKKEGVRPIMRWGTGGYTADRSARVMVRRRQT